MRGYGDYYGPGEGPLNPLRIDQADQMKTFDPPDNKFGNRWQRLGLALLFGFLGLLVLAFVLLIVVSAPWWATWAWTFSALVLIAVHYMDKDSAR